jgi:hypothetical protein
MTPTTPTELGTAHVPRALPGTETFAGMIDAVHRDVAPADHLVPSPDGVILASPAALGAAPFARLIRDGHTLSLPHAAPPGGQPFTRFGGGVALVRPGRPGQPVSAEAAAFARGLMSAQCLLLHRVLALALCHLDSRSSGGMSLLSKRQIQAVLGEAAAELAEAGSLASVLASENEPPGQVTTACRRASRRLRASGRDLLRALGGSGFLATSAAGDVHLAEVACAIYLCPHPAAERNGR